LLGLGFAATTTLPSAAVAAAAAAAAFAGLLRAFSTRSAISDSALLLPLTSWPPTIIPVALPGSPKPKPSAAAEPWPGFELPPAD
jgi:hypothetical protein